MYIDILVHKQTEPITELIEYFYKNIQKIILYVIYHE